jgi:hypothetical protein
MSRTDRHRPHRVQVADPYERHRWHRISDHHWTTLWPLYRFGCRSNCYCSSYWTRIERRHVRHTGQRRLREAIKGNWEILD